MYVQKHSFYNTFQFSSPHKNEKNNDDFCIHEKFFCENFTYLNFTCCLKKIKIPPCCLSMFLLFCAPA